MRVIMRAQISGTRDGQEWPARGQAIDLPDTEAADLLNAGLATPSDDPAEETTPSDDPVEETAVTSAPVEVATTRRRRA